MRAIALLLPAALLLGAGLRGTAQTAGSRGDVSIAAVLPSNEIAEVQPAGWMGAGWMGAAGMGATAAELPDAPEPQQKGDEPKSGDSQKALMTADPNATARTTTSMPMAPMYSRVIPAGMSTPQIHKWDKITLATRDLYSLSSFADYIVSAGYSHVTNGQPNYGTDSGAFGQRLGAAAIRDSSQAFLSNGPFAVWLHQDPRYFAMGRGHSLGKRAIYAITRPFVTRDSSDGHAVFNSSLILGQAVGVGLSNLYYPESNQNFHDNMARFAGSIGGSGLSFALDEFTSDLLRAFRLRRLERMMQ